MAYDIVQSTFMISLSVNGVSGLQKPQPVLVDYLSVMLKGGDIDGKRVTGFFPEFNKILIGGDWQVAWGPCVYSSWLEAVATNAMYVAYSPSQKTYVVAIAGTNAASLYDWIYEDLMVAASDMAPWPLVLPYDRPRTPPSGPAVSGGTALGVSNLLCSSEMVDASSGLSLEAFLAEKRTTDATLIFCGHSLGGALSPTLAFHLYPEPAKSGWKTVQVLPTAGPTPGNTDFSNLYNRASAYAPVPTSLAPYSYWNTDYVNDRDIVPHAWNRLHAVVSPASDGKYFNSIYGALDRDVGSALWAFCAAGMALAAGGAYAPVTPCPFSPDWGFYDWTCPKPPCWRSLPENHPYDPVTSLAALAFYVNAAHVDQYLKYFGVVLAPPLSIIPDPLVTVSPGEAHKRVLQAAARLSPQRLDQHLP